MADPPPLRETDGAEPPPRAGAAADGAPPRREPANDADRELLRGVFLRLQARRVRRRQVLGAALHSWRSSTANRQVLQGSISRWKATREACLSSDEESRGLGASLGALLEATLRDGGGDTWLEVAGEGLEGPVRLPCHWAIVCARVPYVASLHNFEQEARGAGRGEGTGGRRTIALPAEVVSEAAARAVLEYCYTGQVTATAASALGLLRAATFLRLEGLARLCASHLAACVAAESVLHVLEAGIECSSPELVKAALDYTTRHPQELSQRWELQFLSREALALLLAHLLAPGPRQCRLEHDSLLRALIRWGRRRAPQDRAHAEVAELLDAAKKELAARLPRTAGVGREGGDAPRRSVSPRGGGTVGAGGALGDVLTMWEGWRGVMRRFWSAQQIRVVGAWCQWLRVASEGRSSQRQGRREALLQRSMEGWRVLWQQSKGQTAL